MYISDSLLLLLYYYYWFLIKFQTFFKCLKFSIFNLHMIFIFSCFSLKIKNMFVWFLDRRPLGKKVYSICTRFWKPRKHFWELSQNCGFHVVANNLYDWIFVFLVNLETFYIATYYLCNLFLMLWYHGQILILYLHLNFSSRE